MSNNIIDKEYLEKMFPKLISRWRKIDKKPSWQIPREKMWNVVETINTVNNISNYNLLDLGCDCGLHSIIASQRFKRVVGIEKKEHSYKKALFSKRFFIKQGYNLSNLQIIGLRFKGYVNKGFFEKDNINAILAAEVLPVLKDDEIIMFSKKLEFIKFIMIQTRRKKKRELAKNFNSFELDYAYGVFDFLKNNFFNNIKIFLRGGGTYMVVARK